MSKKIFIITGESSGDKIASLLIKKIKEKIKEINEVTCKNHNLFDYFQMINLTNKKNKLPKDIMEIICRYTVRPLINIEIV